MTTATPPKTLINTALAFHINQADEARYVNLRNYLKTSAALVLISGLIAALCFGTIIATVISGLITTILCKLGSMMFFSAGDLRDVKNWTKARNRLLNPTNQPYNSLLCAIANGETLAETLSDARFMQAVDSLRHEYANILRGVDMRFEGVASTEPTS